MQLFFRADYINEHLQSAPAMAITDILQKCDQKNLMEFLCNTLNMILTELGNSINPNYQPHLNLEQKEIIQNNLAGMVQVMTVGVGSQKIDDNLVINIVNLASAIATQH